MTIATICGDMGLAGELGRGIAMLNLNWFGYLGYVYLLFFIYPAYAVYKDSNLDTRRVKVICGVLFICAGILVVQFALFGRGKVGELLIAQISPFVGIVGVVLATFFSFLVGILLLMPDKIFWIKDKLVAIFSFLWLAFMGVSKWILGICSHSAKAIWSGFCALFASENLKGFNPPLKEAQNMQESQENMRENATAQYIARTQDFANDFRGDLADDFRRDSMPNSQNLQNQAMPNPPKPFWEQSIFDTPKSQNLAQNPHSADSDFDARQVNITYTNKDKERENQEKQERKYAQMVRIVGEGEEGEVLQINVDEALERARKRDIEITPPNEPLQAQLTKVISDMPQNPQENTQNITQENPSNTQNTANTPTNQTLFGALDFDTQKNLALDSSDFATPNENTPQNPNSSQNLNAFQNLNATPNPQNPNSTPNTRQDIATQASASQANQSAFAKPTPSKTFEASDTLLKELDKGTLEKPKDYTLPDTSYLATPPQNTYNPEEDKIDQKICDLEHKLKTFKINGSVERFYLGPVVTTFEFVPEASVKVSRIQSLSNDLALALSAHSIRIQAPIPGKGAVGIEVPNNHRETIYLREVLESELFKNAASPLALGLGKDLVGNPFVTDLKKLPHLLIAGTTGSGKSVGVNAMILSLLYRNSPQNLRLIMIDPKQVEFSLYDDIPHLLTPIITEAEKAIIALNNLTREMERRYKLMKECKTKTIDNYNTKAKQEGGEIFPFIVVIIDELADLMMTGGKNAEAPIIRIAQMGRAAGLHLIVATQRPSVDVVTGLIKTNLPAKIAFKVGTRTDSRVILDNDGAQNLLGNGDMLFSPGGSGLLRLHAPWVSEKEIESIVEFICSQGAPEYDTSFLSEVDEGFSAPASEIDEMEDFGVEASLLQKAKDIMKRDGKTSISHLQTRGLGGYPKCKKIVFQLEKDGFLSAPDSKGTRYIIGD